MASTRVVLSVLAALCLPAALWAADAKTAAAPAAAKTAPVSSAPKLTVAQVIDKHLAARGGQQAWRGVNSMTWNGKLEAGFADSVARSQRYVSNAMASKGKLQRMALLEDEKKAQNEKQVELPFVMEMKRPTKSRVEVQFAGQTSVQVYDGKQGWMKRPYLNREDWEPFTKEQTQAEASTWGLQNPLFDYPANGARVALEGVEPVEGHDAYKLKLTLAGGAVQHVWIDAQSFLDVKVEGTPRRMDGKMHTVWVYQRDFRPVQGLMVPFVLETAVVGYRDTHKMTIEKVGLNPQLDDGLFVKPTS